MRIRSPDGGRRSGQSSHAIPGAKACPGWRRECRFLRFLGGLHRLDAEQGSLVGVRMTAECHPILLEPYTQPCWPNQVPGRRAAVKARPGGGAPGRAPPPSTAERSAQRTSAHRQDLAGTRTRAEEKPRRGPNARDRCSPSRPEALRPEHDSKRTDGPSRPGWNSSDRRRAGSLHKCRNSRTGDVPDAVELELR